MFRPVCAPKEVRKLFPQLHTVGAEDLQFGGLLKLEPIGGKGLGVTATQDIPPLTIVLCEDACVRIQTFDTQRTVWEAVKTKAAEDLEFWEELCLLTGTGMTEGGTLEPVRFKTVGNHYILTESE